VAPPPLSRVTVRPNSPPQMTSVSLSSPRCLRSLSSAAAGWSISWAFFLEVGFEIAVVIPAAGEHLHEAHAALDEPTGHEHAGAGLRHAVHVAHVLRLLRNVEGLGCFGLHAEGHLERLDARVELLFLLHLLAVERVELVREIELPALAVGAGERVADVSAAPG
jgi:hypothetical protein